VKLVHVRRAWESYRELAVPVDAGVVQVEESRQAFFAGAAALFFLLTRPVEKGGILTAGPDADDESQATMDGLESELAGYAAEKLRKVTT